MCGSQRSAWKKSVLSFCYGSRAELPSSGFMAGIFLRVWWHMPSISGFERQRQAHEFEVSLVYRASSRTARATQRNSVLKTQINKNPDLWGWRDSSAPWLGALLLGYPLPEDLVSVPRTHTTAYIQILRCSLLASLCTAYMHNMHNHASKQNTSIYNIK